MPILRNRTRPAALAAPSDGPPPERVAFQAAVTGSGPADLKAAAMKAARAFFAGRDVTTLEIESGWKASRATGDYQAKITVWGVIGGPEARCPECFGMAALAADGTHFAEHDHPRSSYRCPGSGAPDYACAAAALRQEMESEQRCRLARDEAAYQRADTSRGDDYRLRVVLSDRRDLLREWEQLAS